MPLCICYLINHCLLTKHVDVRRILLSSFPLTARFWALCPAQRPLSLGHKQPVWGHNSVLRADQGQSSRQVGAGGGRRDACQRKAPAPARPQGTARPVAPRSVLPAKLSDLGASSFLTLSVSRRSPPLIRRRCPCANKISSFNLFPKCECSKEKAGLVTRWLFLFSATHLPFGPSVPIQVHSPSLPSTHAALPACLGLCQKCCACRLPSLPNPDKSRLGCVDSACPAPTLYCPVGGISKPGVVGTTNLGEGVLRP